MNSQERIGAATGADALGTITPRDKSGDFDLADCKARAGDRICLFGGFDERVLQGDDPRRIREEVKRCLDAAGAGGRYVLHGTGLLMGCRPESVRLVAEAVHRYGTY